MAVIYENKICVFANELIIRDKDRKAGSLTGFLPKGSFDTMIRRGQLTILRRASRGNSALVDFDSMRMDIKERYMSIYGDPRAQLAQVRQPSAVEGAMNYSTDAQDYFTAYRYDESRSLSPAKIAEYTLHARLIEAIWAVWDERKSRETGGGSTRINKWERISAMINEMKLLRDKTGKPLYPHSLPENWKSLKRKCEAYRKAYTEQGAKGAYYSLIHKNYGNDHAAKVQSSDMDAVMHTLIGRHNNLNNAQIKRQYNRIATHLGEKPIESPRTVARYKKEMELTTALTQKGKGYVRDKLSKQAHRAAPELPMTFWTTDGWTVELLYKKTHIVKRGGKEYRNTTYTNRKVVVVLLDACGKYPIGYAIGDKENTDLIRAALRNAFHHVTELFGARYKPIQIQSDNFSKGAMSPVYEACSRLYTPVRAGNHKGNSIEPYWNHLNRTYCQEQLNWSGHNVTASKKNQPNLEIINEHHHLVPDEQTVMDQIHWIISQERAVKLEAYMQAWAKVPQDRRVLFSTESYLLTLGVVGERTHRFTPSGLYLERHGERICYESFDKSLRGNLGEDWVVRYDPEDMSQVLITNAVRQRSGRISKETGTLRYLLQKERIIPMAIVDQTEEDRKHLSAIRTHNQEQRAMIEARRLQVRDQIVSLQARVPGLLGGNDLLETYLITDSRGQHKNRRTENRLLEAQRVQEADFELLPDHPPTTWEEDEDYEFDPAQMSFSR